MNKIFYTNLAPWLHKRIDDYIDFLHEGGARLEVKQSGDWETLKMRASSTDACPKFCGAEKRGEVKKVFGNQKKWQFELANRAADVVKEAVLWAASEENYRRRDPNSLVWDAYTEYRMDPDDKDYAGTPDALLIGRRNRHEASRICIPVEIKRTDTDKYEGVTPSQVWQLITYMKLFEAEGGMLVTIYNWASQSGTHKVWPVLAVEGGWQVFNADTAEPIEFEGDEWPADSFFTEEDFIGRVIKHEHHYADRNLPAPYEHPNWRCGWIKSTEFYARNYTHPSTGQKFKAGDVKPNSGTILPTCPLFDLCWNKDTRQQPVEPVEIWWERF